MHDPADDWFVDPDVTTDLGGEWSRTLQGEAQRDFDFGDGDGETTQRFELPPRPGQGRGRGGQRPGRPAASRRPSRAEPRRPVWQRLALGAGALAALLLVASFAVRLIYADRALPGTTVGDVSVGGMTEDEIRSELTKLTDPERRIELVGAGKQLRVSVGGAGLQPDVPATTDAALDAGRGWLLAPLVAALTGSSVDLVAVIDSDALRGSVARIAGEIDRKPYAGALEIDPGTLTVTTRASAEGREVERGELGELLQRELLAPTAEPLQIPITTTAAVSAERVSEVAEDAEQYLQRPLIASGAGKPYEISPQALAGILALEPLDGGRRAQLSVDEAATAALAKRIAEARDRTARNASLSAPSRGPTVDGKGEVSWRPRSAEVRVIGEARNGLEIDQARLAGRIRNAVREDEHAVKVPAKVAKPAVSAEQAKKVDQLIGTFTTYYEAGQPRVTNIQRIARSVDRTVIGPGQQFSLNGISGERTKAKGYVEAPFIAENRIEPSVGGGVSQFSTTMYNAAYFAGLQIDAFRPHSLFIARYPAGRESTLNFPDIDMRWTNDTGAPILIRTAADDAGVTVTLYGDNGGRRVSAEPGPREPNPGGDFKITVTRVIRYGDGRTVEQPTTTSYAIEVTDEPEPQE